MQLRWQVRGTWLPEGHDNSITPMGFSDFALHRRAWMTAALKARAEFALAGTETPTEVHTTPAAFLANEAETFSAITS